MVAGKIFVSSAAVRTTKASGRETMPDNKKNRGKQDRAKVARFQGYEVNYFARKHDISTDQAERLIAQIGNDRERLNDAAKKLKRR